MRSKKRIVGILIMVIVVLLGFVSAIFLINKYNNPRNKKENISSNIYNEKVDSAIDSVLFSKDYNSLSLDEKKDRMLSILYQLEKDGEILKDSIFYQESEKAIWFQYPDGFEDGVILESSKNGYSGNANIDDYIVRKDEQGRILSYNCAIDFNSNEYPYTAKEVKSLDLKAKFMYGLGYDSILDEYKKYQTLWNKQYLKTDIDDYCTVEDFKSSLSGHDIIFIEEHGILYESGGLLKIKTPLICTTEEFIKGKYNDDKANLLFPKSDNGKRYYYIKPSFFKKYYGDEKLKGTIVWIGSCHGYQRDDLVNTFSRCGAKAVIGYDESILTGYDCVMLNPFVYSLLYGDSVSEALNFAKSVFGQNDLEYWTTYNGTKSKFGTIALMPPGKTNCATAKLYPGSENARLIDAEIIGAQRGGEIKSKTQSTEPMEITEIPTESTTQTSAIDLIDKTLPEIISLMNGEYQIIKTENDGYIYIQNQSVLSGIEFYVQVSGDDIISANNGEEIHSDTLKAKLESGELTLDGIQINKSGKVSNTIQADMDYKSCSKVLGDFDCIGSTGGYLGGDVSSISYDYNDNNAKVILNFNIPEEIYRDLSLGKISSVSTEEMKSHNPKLKNVVIRKSEANTSNNNSYVNIKDYEGAYYPTNSEYHVYLEISNVVENSADVYIEITNNGGTRVSENTYIGNITNNTITFETQDGFGKNQFTLEFNKGKIYLTGRCIDCYSNLWGIPEMDNIEMQYKKTILFTGTVNTEKDPLNVRKSPSTEAKIIGRIDKGSTVTVYSESDGWCEIEYNGGIGYVSKEYISCSSGGFAKPVIYLYPENKQDISVKVNFKNGDFTCTYPEYNNGWNVTAYPDGKIINKADNDEYSYLYWEGEGKMNYDFSSGFIVKKEDTAKFLKEKLSYMGLTPKEYNEFIVYWLPIMQENEYNLISFQTDNYEESAKLEIYPKPDSMLRVFMAFKEVSENTIVPEQKLESFKRNGFTVIEWGGTEIN